MRRLNSRFHIDKDQLVKTSNGQPIPPEEPVFIVRGRDHLAIELLNHYRGLCIRDGCNEQFLEELDVPINEFRQFAIQYYDRMKQPGVTSGK